MNFLLFTIFTLFASIFHFFAMKAKGMDFFFNPTSTALSLETLSWNLSTETVLFLLGWIISFLIFQSWSFPEKQRREFDLQKTSKNISLFFQTYIYYIGFFFFYFSFYLILSYFSLPFDYFLFCINSIVLILFVLNKNFFIFRDLIKISTIFSALYLISFYLYSFTLTEIVFTKLDFVNGTLIFLFFVLNIFFDIKHLKRQEADKSLIIYFTIYAYLMCSFYLFLIFDSLLFIISLTGTIFTLILYYYLPNIFFLKNHIFSLRALSLCISYITILFSVFFLYYEYYNFYGLPIACFLIFFSVWNLYIHRTYQNYFSLIFSLFGISFVSYFFCFNFIIPFTGNFSLLVFTYILSFSLICSLYFFNWHHVLDSILIAISVFFIQIFGIVSFFSLQGFDILTFWSILLLESLSFFALYYKINPLLPKYEPVHQKHESHSHGHH